MDIVGNDGLRAVGRAAVIASAMTVLSGIAWAQQSPSGGAGGSSGPPGQTMGGSSPGAAGSPAAEPPGVSGAPGNIICPPGSSDARCLPPATTDPRSTTDPSVLEGDPDPRTRLRQQK
jgi:hypothetical protein